MTSVGSNMLCLQCTGGVGTGVSVGVKVCVGGGGSLVTDGDGTVTVDPDWSQAFSPKDAPMTNTQMNRKRLNGILYLSLRMLDKTNGFRL
jgi:hypothetical protein